MINLTLFGTHDQNPKLNQYIKLDNGEEFHFHVY